MSLTNYKKVAAAGLQAPFSNWHLKEVAFQTIVSASRAIVWMQVEPESVSNGFGGFHRQLNAAASGAAA